MLGSARRVNTWAAAGCASIDRPYYAQLIGWGSPLAGIRRRSVPFISGFGEARRRSNSVASPSSPAARSSWLELIKRLARMISAGLVARTLHDVGPAQNTRRHRPIPSVLQIQSAELTLTIQAPSVTHTKA